VTQPLRIVVLTRRGEDVNAIHDASACLVEALNRKGNAARLIDWAPGAVCTAALGSDVVAVPYNPFLYGRWGFAPSLMRDVARVRRRASRPRVTLLVHETYVGICDWKSLLMGAWQRIQLWTLLVLADYAFASIETWAAKLSRIRRTSHLPSGSTLPDGRAARDEIRAELGISDHLVVATLSTGHPSHLTSYVASALRRIAAAGTPTTFLQLGATASAVDGIPAGMPVIRPGRLPPERLAASLAAADVLLTPFEDGVSTRRTSFIAGLQQGVAVVGTTGALTDSLLESANLELVDVGNPNAFAERAALLAVDHARRGHAAAAGRALFEREFTWEVLASRFLQGVSKSDPR
jgi:glycosyltransferase involved in cell wall biosynthesis